MKGVLPVGVRHQPLTVILTAIGIALSALFWAEAARANPWEYGVTPEETEVVNPAATSAVVDTEKREIRLPRGAGTVAFAGEDVFDYIVLAPDALIHYSFDGQEMVENSILSIRSLSNPLAAAASGPYPDVIVAQGQSITHYSFTGNGMAANPTLSIAGLTHVVSVGSRGVDTAALSGDKIEYHAFDGSEMVRVPALSVEQGLTNPIDLALLLDSYDMILLDGNRVRYFAAGTENPAMAVTGIERPRAVAAADGWFAVVSGKEVRSYQVQSGSIAYSTAFSVTEGLESPSAVALRPGARDMLVVDGDEVRYYMFDGARMVHNPQLSKTVTGLKGAGAYARRAVVQSRLFDPGMEVTHVRVRAYHNLPPQTMVTWEVTADGEEWLLAWRVSPDGGLELYDHAEDEWKTLGPAFLAQPDRNNSDLWIPVSEGSLVGWRATLETRDALATPKVVAGLDDAAVVWEAGAAPDPPIPVQLPDGCFLTSSPEITWLFRSPDPEDYQTAFEFLVRPKSNQDHELAWFAESSETSFRIPTSADPDVPGPLWSMGDWEYELQLRTFGRIGVPSEWTAPLDFCVLAFDRPRVQEAASRPAGQEVLPMVITEGMAEPDLPRVKAGSLVRFLVDIIGPIPSVGAEFPYGQIAGEAAVDAIEETREEKVGTNSRWEVRFWTDASLDEVPSGTLVRMILLGFLDEAVATELRAPPYADGVVVIRGSVYEDWFVALQPRDVD